MFEKLIENRLRLSSFIGAKVVDDTEDFNMPVSLPPPPPEEGKATILYVTKPDTFTPGEPVHINIQIRNDGGADTFFFRITNKDTGAVLEDYTATLTVQPGHSLSKAFDITLTQTTDFHGKIEVGHIE